MPRKRKRQNDLLSQLHVLAFKWEEDASYGRASSIPYVRILRELLFHCELRFGQYTQFQDEGEFTLRLKQWLDNVSADRDKQALFRVLNNLVFIDRYQMRSLYRDAYRKIVATWIASSRLTFDEMLAEDYELKLLSVLQRHAIWSITRSFDASEFLKTNNLTGIDYAGVLDVKHVLPANQIHATSEAALGIIVFEDFVATGSQAISSLRNLLALIDASLPVLFVPLIVLEGSLTAFANATDLARVEVRPVVVLQDPLCVRPTAQPGEPSDFPYIRAIINSTASRVLTKFNDLDDPPTHPFGWHATGALVVTYHNTPNNTIPLIHHRAPAWVPLFRRLTH